MNSTTPAAPSGSTQPAIRRRIVIKRKVVAAAADDIVAAPEVEIDAASTETNEEEAAGSNWRQDGSYVVGKGKTPVHTRWQKGQSGNPRGKKKGTPNTDTIIIDLMETPITVKTANGERKMSRKAAFFQRMWELAAKGDLKAAKFLFDRYGEAQGRRADKDVEQEALSDAEMGELASFMTSLRFGESENGSETLS
jgi:hypothetical protein